MNNSTKKHVVCHENVTKHRCLHPILEDDAIESQGEILVFSKTYQLINNFFIAI